MSYVVSCRNVLLYISFHALNCTVGMVFMITASVNICTYIVVLSVIFVCLQYSSFSLFATSLFPVFTAYYRWRRGVVVSGVRRMNEVNARWARLVPGWVTVFGWYTSISVCNKPARSTQPCIHPGSLNRVPALPGVRARMSPLLGGR